MPCRLSCAGRPAVRWRSWLNSLAIALLMAMCGQSPPAPAGAAGSEKDGTAPPKQSPATMARVESDSLKLSVEVPPGWRIERRGNALTLFSEAPSTAVIEMDFYQPRNEAQYDDWTAWVKKTLPLVSSERTLRRRRATVIDGHKAIRLDTREKGASGRGRRIILETWIARPSAEAPTTGEVFVVLLQGPDNPAFVQAYDRVLASLRLQR
jgi:hypothetical protein